MSAVLATTMVPDSFRPWHWNDALPRARGSAGPARRLAEVVRLYPPSERSISAPVRLTRRGVAVLSGAVAGGGCGTRGRRHGCRLRRRTRPAAARCLRSVVVHSGDTLWTIAGRIAPDRDTWAEVTTLRQINHLDAAWISPSARCLRTR